VGYAGGRQPDPTYRRLGDHTETIQIDFDPSRVDYDGLLALFWQSHNPTASRPRQYRSVIFYHDAAQRRSAEASRDREKLRRQTPLTTEILPLDAFYRAENYHQKYYLRRETDLLLQLQRFYPASRDLIDAPSAARINGYIGGFGSAETLAHQAEHLGLSPAGHRRLRNLFEWRQP
jgi:peptide-methionine (S)-S-oxide reductase